MYIYPPASEIYAKPSKPARARHSKKKIAREILRIIGLGAAFTISCVGFIILIIFCTVAAIS